MLDLPAAFIARMRALLGDEAEALLTALRRPPQAGLRVNTLKIAPDELRRRVPWQLAALPWCPSGFVVQGAAEQEADRAAPVGTPGRHPWHAAGLYYLQEPSAMAVAEALDVQPGQCVLDLAAAPGGKATHIAALLGDRGLLVANEVERSRIKALGENLERWGAHNVLITNEAVERLVQRWGALFDRVLLDAPCSGEGMFRKLPQARAEWSVQQIQGCAARQARILEQAAHLVRPGGLLVYSTCTFAPEENEQRIAAFLRAHPDWRLEPIPPQPGFAPARPDWVDPPLPELVHAVRLWPHRLAGEGHFIARLRRAEQAGAAPPAADLQSASGARLPAELLAAWQAFARATLRVELPLARIAARGDHLVLLPEVVPPLDGVRVVRAGVWLGTRRPGRFEPAHALALAVRAEDVHRTHALDERSVVAYLRGEPLREAGADGWLLMTFAGAPLGWGRRSGGVIKNFYPRGLRRSA